MLPIVAGGVIAIGLAFWFNRVRMLLDLWLAVACLAMVLDVLLSLLSHPFAVGWYASRINVLIATSALLIVLLLQTAKIYGQLASTAERLRSETLTDPLTGLINRRGFDRRVAQALRDCARSGKPVAMLMLDVDNFKVYNDTFGHQAGDECLRKVSDAVRTAAGRAGDLVARLGGEELAVIMPDTDVEGAGVVAERMRRAVQSLRIPQGPGAAYDIVTLSAGVSSATNAANTDAERLMNDADRALYAAKNAGRNRAFQSGRLSEGPAYAG
jgi:diguanylate cyclase (GGDEF)-like protein